MKLFETLYNYTNDELKKLVRLCIDRSSLTRKDQMVVFLLDELLTPAKLRHHWARLDALSQKAVAAAYHNDGGFDANAFVAQYGSLPERPKRSEWYYTREPLVLDLFIQREQIPSDLMPLLAEFVPPPEKFQVMGLVEAPQTADSFDEPQPLWYDETEEAGLHDLAVFLRLVEQGQIKLGTSGRLTPTSVPKLCESLLHSDFLPLPEKPQLDDTIRPFGLQIFAQEAGLVSASRSSLTPEGKAFIQTQDPEQLLAAFETWTAQGSFDELARIPAIRGQRARNIRLTKPGQRRAAIVEALSWCPTGVWIPIEEFYRALKVWHFDFALEEGHAGNLYIGYGKEVLDYGWADAASQWLLTKGLYVNAVLWEYLGVIGALDLLYLHPEDAAFPAEAYYFDEESFSRYDGLKYFRINRLGAYLLGQASSYEPAHSTDKPLYTLTGDLRITLCEPEAVTPNLHSQLLQIAHDEGDGRYRLDTQLLLTALEEGSDFTTLRNFLEERNNGPMPSEVTTWLEQVQVNSRAFSLGAQALLIKARTLDLVQQALADPTLGKFCQALDDKTIVIPANREKALRSRLKELGYGVV